MRRDDDAPGWLVALVAVPVLMLLAFAVIVSTLLNGWVLHIAWNWFMPEIFGLPMLGMAQAIALGLLVSFLTYHGVFVAQEQSNKKIWTQFALYVCVRPFLFLLVAWIVKGFV